MGKAGADLSRALWGAVGQRLAAVAAAFSLLSVFLLSAVGAAPAAAGTQSWSHRDARVCG